MNEILENPTKTIRDFVEIIKDSFATQGYLTDKIGSFLTSLETNPTYTYIAENALAFVKEKSDRLQNFSLTVAVLHNFRLPTEIQRGIAQAALQFLEEKYQQPDFDLTQYAIDTRLAAWNLLRKTIEGQTEEQKAKAGELASKTGGYEPENDVVQTFAVQYNLDIATKRNKT